VYSIGPAGDVTSAAPDTVISAGRVLSRRGIGHTLFDDGSHLRLSVRYAEQPQHDALGDASLVIGRDFRVRTLPR